MAKVREILKGLIAQNMISEWKLADETGIPQSTISAITTGRSKEQRDSTLQPIADYFGITLTQLRGYEPIENLTDDSLSKEASLSNHYPVVNANQIQDWIDGNLSKSDFEEFETSSKTATKGPRTFIYVATDDSLKGVSGLGNLGDIGKRYFIDPEFSFDDYETSPGLIRIALIRMNNKYSLRVETDDFGETRYKAAGDGYKTIASSECDLIGYLVGIPEQTWTA